MSKLNKSPNVTGKRALLWGTASTVALCLAATMPAHAQDDAGDEIVIQGIKRSLEDAQSTKQNADTFVDSISASDIGALPDASVLEALQRVPGVSITRFQAADDPDHFAVEGAGQVIRGLTLVRSEFNGRDAFSANNGRALGFNDVPAELVGGVDVFKNQTADMIEGGISGIVNLRTLKPFDRSGFTASLSAEYTYGDLADEWAPSYTGLVSNRFDTEAGEFGFLLSYTDSSLASRADGFQLSAPYPRQDFNGTGQDVATIPSANIRTTDYERDRQGLSLAGQWASTDGTMLATAQFIRSESDNAWTEHTLQGEEDPGYRASVEISDLVTSPFSSEGITATRDDNTRVPVNAIFQSGLLTNSSDGWHGRYGIRQTAFTRVAQTNTVTEDSSFNFKYTPNDTWKFNFDVQFVDSTTENSDITAFAAQYLDQRLLADGENSTIEYLVNGNPANDGGFGDLHTSTTDPTGTYWRANMDHFEDSEGDLFAIRGDVQYDFNDDGWFKSVRVGARFSEREQLNKWSTYNWGNMSEAWAGGEVRFSDLPGSVTEEFQFDDFQRGGVLLGSDTFLFPAVSIVSDYDALVALRDDASLFPGASWQPRRAGNRFLDSEISDVVETTQAAYVRLDFGTEDFNSNGMTLDGNIGLRYVDTEISTAGSLGYTPLTSADVIALVPEATAFMSQDAIVGNFGDTDTQFLPSLNLKLGLNEDMIVRFGASRGLTRPDTGLLRAGRVAGLVSDTVSDQGTLTSVTLSSINIQGGNPELKPTLATNLDLSYEWYFADVGSFTASLFYKDLEDVVNAGEVLLDTITLDGQQVPIRFVGAVNADEGNVQGLELAYQQFYDFLPGPLANFGIQANYTYVDASIPNSDVNNTRGDGVDDFGSKFDVEDVEQLSEHTANIVGIWQNDYVEGRLAYNYRSDYLLTTVDVISRHPIYQEATGTLDGSFKWNVTDNFQVNVQGVNLLDEVTETSLQVDDAGQRTLRSLFVNDRRFTFGARYQW